MSRRKADGFTLVEVLAVIAIIGILIGLLLPAVQMAREAARRNQCINNLKQIGVAVQVHHNEQRQYPSGRDGEDEFSVSWAFNLLPFMEEEAVFRSRVANQPAQSAGHSSAMRTPVPIFYCPSRRNPAADRDFTEGPTSRRLAGVAAGGDYAANSGSESCGYGVLDGAQPLPRIDPQVAGPMFTFSRISARQVSDGLSKTIAVGERYLPPPRPDVPLEMTQIVQGDTAFFCGDLAQSIMRTSKDGFPGGNDDPSNEKFGSEHAAICHVVMLDGHVKPIRYDLDNLNFHRLSAIADGEIIADELR